MTEKIKMFLNEYNQLCINYIDAKNQGNTDLAKLMDAKKQTLGWVLIELGYKQEVNDINQGVWKG